MTTQTFEISRTLTRSILAAARKAHPEECCGLIVGHITTTGWRAHSLHPARNVADDPGRYFVIDPELHFQLLRELRGSKMQIIGCYHSHPGHPPRPSEADRLGAADQELIWLIAGGTAEHGFRLKAFQFDDSTKDFSEIACVARSRGLIVA